MIAGIQALLPLLLYTILIGFVPEWNNLTFVTYAAQAIWWPTFFAWLCTSFFDSQQVRAIFRYAVMISLAGPFMIYWVGWGDILMSASKTKNWGILTIIFVIVMFAYNVGSIVYLLIFVPKVFDWVDNAAIFVDDSTSDLADAIDAIDDEPETLLANF